MYSEELTNLMAEIRSKELEMTSMTDVRRKIFALHDLNRLMLEALFLVPLQEVEF